MLTTDRRTRLDRIEQIIKPEFRACRNEQNFNCLTDELKKLFNIVDTSNVSENSYHEPALALFRRHQHGLVLDFGAGKRNIIYDQVINMEIVSYDSTDVICLGEQLPFLDNVFDAVHSNAVLEHVKDPFACAKEILGIEVYEELHPITSLIWFVSVYQAGLDEISRSEFLDLRLRDLVGKSFWQLKSKPYIFSLPQHIKQELASCNTIFGYKKSCEVGRCELSILEALYGTDKTVYDVTNYINEMVNDNHIFLSVGVAVNEVFGDPCPGVPKKLKVRWECGVRSGEETINEFAGRLTTPLCL